MTTANTEKNKKAKGPIRWNAIIPFVLVSALFYLYFVLFFDLHMKKALEWIGYQVVGAEVDIAQFKSSFIKGNVQISKIEITDKDNPDHNSLEIGDVRFDLNWNALLKVKFVVEEIAVEGVQLMSKRAYPGKVAPPPPSSNEPSLVDQLQSKALNKLDKDNQNNVLSDVAQFLQTGKFDDQIKNLDSQLQSKKMLEDLNKKWADKKTEWDAKLKTLPNSQDLKNLSDRFGKIKYKDFANIQELDASVKEAQALIQEVDAKSKQTQDVKSQLDSDLKSLDQDYKALDNQIKKDIDTVKNRLKIPKIDAASFAKALFMDYLRPYLAKIDHYRALAEQYLPPKYAKMVAGQTAKEENDSIQALPRAQGVTYEFPVKNGYPLFWIQKVSISSKSNARTDYGDFSGLISNITSNQRQIGQPTTLKITGDYTKMNIHNILLTGLLDNTQASPVVKFQFNVGSYPLTDLKLMNSQDGSISIPNSDTNLSSSGEIVGFKNYDLKLNNTFNKVNFKISSDNKTVDEILNKTLGTINTFNLQASAKGELKSLDIDIRSSLAGDLEKSFQSLLQNKINEANAQLQKTINNEIDKLKSQFNSQVDGIKNQAQTEINKVQAQIDEQKKQGEQKIDQAKKDFENKTKSQLQQEGQKQLDNLKKKFGL